MKPKTELLIRIINLIIVLGLCLTIYLNGRSLSCDKCELELRTNKPAWKSSSYTQEKTTVKIIDLYDSIKEDHCVLKWDKNSGWIYNE